MFDADVLISNTKAEVKSAIDTVAAQMVEDMKAKLSADGHVYTGALLGSIRATPATEDGDIITAYIYADAKSLQGVQYAKFIENGTGIYNPNSPRASSGEGWHYMGRDGKWHFTRGMKADPFISPAFEQNIPMLDAMVAAIGSRVTSMGRNTK